MTLRGKGSGDPGDIVIQGCSLASAIEDDLLRGDFQPIVDLADGAVVGFEALVRWQHPRLGLLLPDAFVPQAELTGAVVHIDRWMLHTALRQLADWKERFPGARRLWVAVNLSAHHLSDETLPRRISHALESAGTEPEGLRLELTETTLAGQDEQPTRLLAALRGLGVRIEIDDFGTGYSTLSRLNSYPIDALKIDKSFITGLERNDADVLIVEAVTALAHELGLEVIAEGVETAGQHRWLQALRCDLGQGLLWGPALPAPAAESRYLAG